MKTRSVTSSIAISALLLLPSLLSNGTASSNSETEKAANAGPLETSAEQPRWEGLVHAKYKTWPAFRYVHEQQGLPRALIIGDSISIGYTTRVQDALEGKVNVWRIPTNAGGTPEGLAKLESWLSWREHWDVIHFNFGMHDFKRRREGSPNPDQLDVSGQRRIDVATYGENLRKIARRLKATGAQVIWAATTPVPPNALGRVPGDEVIYNEEASKVMAEEDIRVNDLHGFILPHLRESPKLQETVETSGISHHDVHFTDPGNDLLAKQVSAEILRALKERESKSNDNSGAAITLRSFGAVGDGRTDDRAAIEKALSEARGAKISGEGLTYAVRGNIAVSCDTYLTDANFVQTMEPPDTAPFLLSARSAGTLKVDPPEAMRSMVLGLPYLRADAVGTYAEDPVPTPEDLERLLPSIKLRTLSIQGEPGRPVSVRLAKVTINRGRHPQSGGRNDGSGLHIAHASPVVITGCTITGHGKGTGMSVFDCVDVRLHQVQIHNMAWAPYAGDTVLEQLTAEQIRDYFGWNNFPIYEYRDGLKRFARVRIQEQLVGLAIRSSQNVEISDSTVEALRVSIGDRLYPLQTDGITLNRVSGITVRNCRFAKVWEGIDFTGAAGDNFVFEDCVAEDCFAYGFKLAHPKQNGKLIRCRAERSGLVGFVIGPKSENILLKECVAAETGAPGFWVSSKGEAMPVVAGIKIERAAGVDAIGRSLDGLATPKDITIEKCAAINKTHPETMAYGILCEAPPEGRNIVLIDSIATGAKIQDIHGFTP